MWILSLVFSWALAQQPNKVDLPFCEPAVFKHLKEAKSLGKWQVIPPDRPQTKVYRSPTQKLSHWVELKIEGHEVIVKSFNEFEILTTVFDKKDCQGKSSKKELETTLSSEGFKDADLMALLSRKQDTMIYIWNPAAGLSVSKARVYLDEAAKRDIKVISLLSPEADAAWAAKEVKKWSLPLDQRRLSSFELVMRGGNLHYPSVFFVGRNRISQRLMGGLEADNVARFFDHFQEIK